MRKRHGTTVLAPLVALALFLVPGGELHGQDLVFQPSVPGFAGGAALQQVNLQLAQAQRPEDTSNAFRRNPLETFQQDLQRQILSQLSRQIVQSQLGGRLGEEGLNLDRPGTFDLGDFVVDVLPGPDALEIRVANVITGNSTVVTVPRF